MGGVLSATLGNPRRVGTSQAHVVNPVRLGSPGLERVPKAAPQSVRQ